MTRPETSTTENAGVRRGEGDISASWRCAWAWPLR